MRHLLWRTSWIQGVEATKERDVWEDEGMGPSKSFETEALCIWDRPTGFDICSAMIQSCLGSIFPHYVSISLFCSVNGILYHCMLERYNLFSDI